MKCFSYIVAIAYIVALDLVFFLNTSTGQPIETQHQTLEDAPRGDVASAEMLDFFFSILIQQSYSNESMRFSKSPTEKKVMRAILLALFRERDYAVKIMQQAVLEDPNFPFAYYNLACIYGLQGQVELSLDALQHAIAQDPIYLKVLEIDTDFDRIRDDLRFKTDLVELKRTAPKHANKKSHLVSMSYAFPLTMLDEVLENPADFFFQPKDWNPEQVMRDGARILKQFDAKHGALPVSHKSVQRVSKLIRKILPEGGEKGAKLDIKLYEHASINAYAFPSGSIRMSSSLVEIMNDDELLAVFGHELAHLALQHWTKTMLSREVLSEWTEGLMKTLSGKVAQVSEGKELNPKLVTFSAKALVQGTFSQSLEAQADDWSIEFLETHGVSPLAAVSALKKLSEIELGTVDETDPKRLLKFSVASHLGAKIRAERLMRKYQDRVPH